MKYMGSKTYMLNNGLGKLLLTEASKANRFIDLFCGSGAVAKFVASQVPVEVISVDLQEYACVLTKSFIGRNSAVSYNRLNQRWIQVAEKKIARSKVAREAKNLSEKDYSTKKYVSCARQMCKSKSRIGPIWNAYGGHYFSPYQALAIDYLLKAIPKKEPYHSVCLSALIETASACCAAPGHTAQPFQADKKGGQYIQESWSKDPFDVCQKILKGIANEYALVKGQSFVCDALDFTDFLEKGDLVFIDPPYSAVQYSRFYHVLETIARRHCGKVSGRGRYPPFEERPRSTYSMKGQAKESLEVLLQKIAKRDASVIFTFPAETCSNGLSGGIIAKIGSKYFTVTCEVKKTRRSSTLGGNNAERNGSLKELVFLMIPRLKKEGRKDRKKGG